MGSARTSPHDHHHQDAMRNRQVGPSDAAQVLADLVPRVTYKDWSFKLTEISRGQGCEGLTLIIEATVPDSCTPGETVGFAHLMPVMPANYDERNWKRWIFQQILLVERHESLEWFRVDGEQSYFPSHAPGEDPYAMVETGSVERAYAAAEPWVGSAPKDDHFA